MTKGYVDGWEQGSGGGGNGLGRTKSLTDKDLEELRGCLDLGFGFSYEDVPELCNTLPALKLCNTMNQKLPEERRRQQRQQQQQSIFPESPGVASAAAVATWRISGPGEDLSSPLTMLLRGSPWLAPADQDLRLTPSSLRGRSGRS